MSNFPVHCHPHSVSPCCMGINRLGLLFVQPTGPGLDDTRDHGRTISPPQVIIHWQTIKWVPSSNVSKSSQAGLEHGARSSAILIPCARSAVPLSYLWRWPGTFCGPRSSAVLILWPYLPEPSERCRWIVSGARPSAAPGRSAWTTGLYPRIPCYIKVYCGGSSGFSCKFCS